MTKRRSETEEVVKVLISLLPSELKQIDDKAERLGLNRSELVRRACAEFRQDDHDHEDW